jgi:predicted N-acyltransferase
MPDGGKHNIRVVESINDIPAKDWDSCANPDPRRFNPFISHAFLRILEESGCASERTGWTPQHLVASDSQGVILGVAPCYLKTHSRGEFVFDQGWARAYEEAGGRYYPKLQCASPFSPVTGRRLLVRPDADSARIEQALIARALRLLEERRASSLHLTFVTADEWRRLGGGRFLQRADSQFHWRNRNYGCFDDFLADLASRKRKSIRRERREALAGGVGIELLTGRDIACAHWDAFFSFYLDTADRKWGHPYLNLRFFHMLGEALGERTLLIMCRRNGRYIGGALNLIGGDALYGRYWGAAESHEFLHFEACYYQAIEYAIAHRIPRVEAGAQGEHKLARGYLPETTYSLHYLADPMLHSAVARYLARERKAVEEEAAMMRGTAPFRKQENPKAGA